MMDHIYRNATVVVALDRLLQTISFRGASPEKLALHILVSDWNQRLWTLQEAKLAKDLCIATLDEIVPISFICQSLMDDLRSNSSPVKDQCVRKLRSLTRTDKRLFQWLHLLRFRSCSFLDDEALVVSTLLGLNTAALTNVVGDARMARLWTMIQRVPRGILFHSSRKIQIENFRWAPSSLICGSGETGISSEREDAFVTPDGLKSKYFVFDLHETFLMERGSLFVILLGSSYISCRHRCVCKSGEPLEMLVDAIAFIRDPQVHRKVLPKTEISAVALYQVGTRNNLPLYRHQYQILGSLEDAEGPEIIGGGMREIIIC